MLADPQVVVTGSPDEVCVDGVVIVRATANEGSGTYMYQWQISPDSLVWTDIAGATNDTLLAETDSAGIFFYQVLLSDPLNGCDADITAAFRLRVVPDPIVQILSDNFVICDGGASLLIADVTGGTGNIP